MDVTRDLSVSPSHHLNLIPSPSSSSTSPSSTNKKKSRLSYSVTFKLAAVRHAESHGNRATARYLGINEKQIRDWRSKKTNLMNTNANAKRLKGAGRQSAGIEPNSKRNKVIPNSEAHPKSNTVFPSPPSTLRYEERYFPWWNEWLPRSEPTTTMLLNERKTSMNFAPSNNNNNFVTHSIKSIMADSPSPKSSSSSGSGSLYSPEEHLVHHNHRIKQEPQVIENEQEVKDKLSCALALLELKKSSENLSLHHRFPLITW